MYSEQFRSRPARSRRAIAAVALIAVAVGLALHAKRSWAVDVAANDDALVAHVLNRVAFGPRPGDVERVRRIGVDAYIDEQLHPERIVVGDALQSRLAALDVERLPAGTLIDGYRSEQRAVRASQAAQAGKTADDKVGIQVKDDVVAARREEYRRLTLQSSEARLVQAIESPRQLEEVMTDFWFNHFNVFVGKDLDRALVANYERDAIRPYVLGHFRDLLGATAKHPAMLFYLDNWVSTGADAVVNQVAIKAAKQPAGLNENYARELMELHTLGVANEGKPGGYSQKDVTELARMLTGWTFDGRATGRGGPLEGVESRNLFIFAPRRHDEGTKEWLGHRIAPNGQQEGEYALDVLAMHPATARHISYELAQYFVADEPPPSLVDRMTARYLATDGDIREVMRTLLASPEFRSPAAMTAKFKTPYQYVVSAARASGMQVVNVQPLVGVLAQLGMPLYGCLTPDGYKNTEAAWLNPEGVTRRINFVTALASGRLPIDRPAPPPQPQATQQAASAGADARGPFGRAAGGAAPRDARSDDRRQDARRRARHRAAARGGARPRQPGLHASLISEGPIMQRRQVVQMLSMAGLASLMPVGRSAWAAVGPTSAEAAGTASRKKMVVIFLRGAVDGLSVVAPYGEADYARYRPTIALPAPGQTDGLLDLDGHFGLHPALAPLMPLWSGGKLAFVHASGSPDPTRSHFDAQDYMESGTPGVKRTSDGWMNRLLGELPGKASPTRGLAVGAVLPRIYAGPIPVASIGEGQGATRPTVLDQPRIADAFAKLYDGDDAASRTFRESLDARREVLASLDPSANEKEQMAANNGAPLPNGFPDDAARLARLMRNDPNVQLAFVALGGWDTHAGQGTARGQLANRLRPLGEGLGVLADRLGPMFDDTVVVVMSEFGRTAHENGNRGTDHGHGNAMWVMGGPVAGGKVLGRWPGIAESSLHEGRDVAVTTDFRDVVAQVAERHLRLPDSQLAQLFPAYRAGPDAPGVLQRLTGLRARVARSWFARRQPDAAASYANPSTPRRESSITVAAADVTRRLAERRRAATVLRKLKRGCHESFDIAHRGVGRCPGPRVPDDPDGVRFVADEGERRSVHRRFDDHDQGQVRLPAGQDGRLDRHQGRDVQGHGAAVGLRQEPGGDQSRRSDRA